MDYKTTLNLPKTDFPMKANLKDLEPRDDREVAAGKDLRPDPGAGQGTGKNYILHDGPPYANGHIHIGHALNKILKDIIVKFKSMSGFTSPYVPGWDCHGLPIEHQVLKNLGSKKDGMSQTEIRKLCREYAEKFIDIQREEFKRLGVFGDWDHPYLTMNFAYEAAIVRELGKFVGEQAACTKARSRCTGAGSTRPPWPRPRWSTRTTSRRRSTCGSRCPTRRRRCRRSTGKKVVDRDLDHHALDAGREPGRRAPSRVRLCCRRDRTARC